MRPLSLPPTPTLPIWLGRSPDSAQPPEGGACRDEQDKLIDDPDTPTTARFPHLPGADGVLFR